MTDGPAIATGNRAGRRWSLPMVAALMAAIVLGAVVLFGRFFADESPPPPSPAVAAAPTEESTDHGADLGLRVTVTPRSGPGIRAIVVENHGSAPVDISGWTLIHVNGRPQGTFTFPVGTVAEPAGSVGFLQTVDTFSDEPCPPDDATHFWGCNVTGIGLRVPGWHLGDLLARRRGRRRGGPLDQPAARLSGRARPALPAAAPPPG